MTRFNIPKQITQGDAVTWTEEIAEYNPKTPKPQNPKTPRFLSIIELK